VGFLLSPVARFLFAVRSAVRSELLFLRGMRSKLTIVGTLARIRLI
jgi:hypothetical protein